MMAGILLMYISILFTQCVGVIVANEFQPREDIHEFQPPQLTFSSDSYLASPGGKDKEASTSPNVSENSVPWTIFQAISSEDGTKIEIAESVRRRTGPLLTTFLSHSSDTNDASSIAHAKHMVSTSDEQRAYLVRHGQECYESSKKSDKVVVERFDLFLKSPSTANLAIELWKYCALYVEGGVYVDAESAPLVALGDALSWEYSATSSKRINYAVVVDSSDAGISPVLFDTPSRPHSSSVVTGTLLAIASTHHAVPGGMVTHLMTTDAKVLEENALSMPRELMKLIAEDQRANSLNRIATIESGPSGGGNTEVNDVNWSFFRQRCQEVEIGGVHRSQRLLRSCRAKTGYCCEIFDPKRGFVVLLSRHPLLPYQVIPSASLLPQPFRQDADLDSDTSAELPFLSTLHEEHRDSNSTYVPGNSDITPNAYEILSSRGGLSDKQACMDCLREKSGANCKSCQAACPTFCELLCEIDVKEKPVKREVQVTRPKYRKDPERIIPRIVHQTWFEAVTSEKYPNMSRLIESWKRSGWEYRFYDDAAASSFISLHFPPEVREAYDSIIPGAFKADLFRYCVLLIEGGIYADMDVMLESNLDAAVPPDIGFMVPVDEPGTKPDYRMCLWNGFIASAPAHPYLARAIQHVVNNIRNRFTVVDYDNMLCPSPELSVPHAFSTLFTAGPCILGMSLNEVLGRGLQTTFEAGELEEHSIENPHGIPGRTIILHQNKWDMGAHRFTWLENNLVVAATDMPDYDDRQELEGEDEEKSSHYSKTQTRTDLYGLDKVYVNRNIVHEKIVFKTQPQQERPVPSSMK